MALSPEGRAGPGEAAEASERADDPGSPKSGAVTGPVPTMLTVHASDAEDVVMHERGSSDEGQPALAVAPTAATPVAGSSAAVEGSDDEAGDDESSPSELLIGSELPYAVVKLRCSGLREGGYQWELKTQPSASPADVESSSGPRKVAGTGPGAGAGKTSATGPRTAAWHAVTAVATELVASLAHPHVRLAVAYTDEARTEALRLFRDLNHLSLRGGISCERVVMHDTSHTVLLQFKENLYACAATFEMSEHCVMLRLLATHPRMTRHGFGRVVIHFLKELGRKLAKQAIVAYTYPNAQPFYEALDFRLTGQLENEMAFNIQRDMGCVLTSLRDLSESHPYACTRRARHEPPTAHTALAPRATNLPADGGAGRGAHGAKTEARIERIWDRRAAGAAGGGACYLVQWAGSAIEEAQWSTEAELAQCARALASFDEARARMIAAMPPTCRPPVDELACALAGVGPGSPPAVVTLASPRSPKQGKPAAPGRQQPQPAAHAAAGRRTHSRDAAPGAAAKQPTAQRKSGKRSEPCLAAPGSAAPTPPRDGARSLTPPPSGRQRSQGADDDATPSAAAAAQEQSRSTLTTGTHAAPGAQPPGADGSQTAMQPPPPFAARAESSSPPLTAIDSDLQCEQATERDVLRHSDTV